MNISIKTLKVLLWLGLALIFLNGCQSVEIKAIEYKIPNKTELTQIEFKCINEKIFVGGRDIFAVNILEQISESQILKHKVASVNYDYKGNVENDPVHFEVKLPRNRELILETNLYVKNGHDHQDILPIKFTEAKYYIEVQNLFDAFDKSKKKGSTYTIRYYIYKVNSSGNKEFIKEIWLYGKYAKDLIVL